MQTDVGFNNVALAPVEACIAPSITLIAAEAIYQTVSRRNYP